jgi:hypothetical protein
MRGPLTPPSLSGSANCPTATVSTLKAAERVIQYAATNPRAEVTYHKSEMKLPSYSDASYLNERNARSRRGGVFFLGDHGRDDLLNDPILCCSSIIDVVVSSAAESEYAAADPNAREATHQGHVGDSGLPPRGHAYHLRQLFCVRLGQRGL